MQFLKDIEELKAIAKALEDRIEAGQRIAEELEQKAAELAEAIANAPLPRTFQIRLADGREFELTTTDGLMMVAALCTNLDMKDAEFQLENGQTVTLRLTDTEQACLAILEASRAVTNGADHGAHAT